MHTAREPRRKVLIRASMRAGGPRTDVCVRDISSRGMMIQTGAPPERGTFVDLDCGGHQIVGLVVWRRDRRFGIQTQDRINVHALASRVPAEVVAAPREATTQGPRAALRASGGSGRTLAGRMEFAVMALFAAALVATLGVTAFQTLSRPFDAISAMLGR